MIDTAKFYTRDFSIRDHAELEIMPSAIDYKTGEQNNHKLFMRENHSWVLGAKAYMNTNRINVTIKPIGDSRDVFCFVQMSIPKFMNGDNFYPIDDQLAKEMPKALESELNKRGIGLDVNDLKVSRIDTFKNVFASEGFFDYVPIFRMLKAKRQNRRDYGSTFLWENKQREICVYDKLQEIQNRGFSIDGLPENTIRFEYRLLNSKSVKKALGFKNAKKLFNNMGSVREVYREALEYHLFGLDVTEFEKLVGSQWQKAITYYSENEGRNWLSKLRQNFGDYGIAKSIGIDRFRDMVEKYSYGRVAGWRVEKAVTEGYQQIELITGTTGSKTHVDLYSELREKVLM